MEYNREVREYFERMGVSVILLLRRNVLKRLISILANAYDRVVKPLNGTHKSHVHSVEEVPLSITFSKASAVVVSWLLHSSVEVLHSVELFTELWDDIEKLCSARLRL